ncbi:hypothetical protein TRVL_07626 [Trypanosoma vivax]|nr:hypothetical protein TRVL_07626 [Trypanosoma vivax]
MHTDKWFLILTPLSFCNAPRSRQVELRSGRIYLFQKGFHEAIFPMAPRSILSAQPPHFRAVPLARLRANFRCGQIPSLNIFSFFWSPKLASKNRFLLRPIARC